jgi:hypothetical protein
MLETMRLRHLLAPSRLDLLLDALVCHSNLVPAGVSRTRDVGGLPQELRALAMRATQRDLAGGCWERGPDTWLVLGEMSLPLSRERGSPVLRIELYTDQGLKVTGLWAADRNGNWSRCSE